MVKSKIQGDQIDMAVFFLYLVKCDATIRYCTVAYSGQDNFSKVPEKQGHVKLVTLYLTCRKTVNDRKL